MGKCPHVMVYSWLPLIAGIFLCFCLSAIQFFQHWISGGPIKLEEFDPEEIPLFLRERNEAFVSQLVAHGYQPIGNCKWRLNDRLEIMTAVWIRQDIIAEINVVVHASKRRSGVSVAIGQEYQDKSNELVSNHTKMLFSIIPLIFSLPGVDDIAILEEVLQAMIARRFSKSLPQIPTNVVEYKTPEYAVW
jgi:hypothetical protein